MRLYLLAIGILFLAVVPAAAQPPDVATVMAKAKAALEPERPSTRRLTIHINMGSNRATEWNAVEARGTFHYANWLLIVVQSPSDAKGIASLTREKAGEQSVAWNYLPVVGRVRELAPVAAFEPFFGTDFTYADLGFVNLRGKYKLLGEEVRAGVKAYKIAGIAPEDAYDSKIITWVAVTNFLPIERDFYDKAGRLWKVERYEEFKDIQNVPTVMKLKMEDKQAGTSSEIEFTDVRYDAKIPTELFDPQKLAVAADHNALVSIGHD